MTEYWPGTDTPKSTDNDFNAVPIFHPEKKIVKVIGIPKRSKAKKPRAKHYNMPPKVDKKKVAEKFDKAMKLLAIKTGAFCPHIPTRDENDRTNSIRMMK